MIQCMLVGTGGYELYFSLHGQLYKHYIYIKKSKTNLDESRSLQELHIILSFHLIIIIIIILTPRGHEQI